MSTGSISGKLDPRHLDALEHPLQDWLKSWWLPAGLGLLGLGAGTALLHEYHLFQLLLVLLVLGCVGLITFMALYLQHLKQQTRIETLLGQLAAREETLAKLKQDHAVLREQAETLQQQDQAKAQVLCVLSHDLRAPFASLKNMLWLFEEGQLSQQETAGLIPRLRHQVDGLYSSLDTLLLWSKNQTDGRHGEILPIPVAAIAREMAEVYRPLAQQKGIEIQAPTPSRALALADADALRLILRNLLDNAIKFTPKQGTICIEVLPEDDHLLLRVDDTGIGMNTGQLNQLFVPAAKNVRRGTCGEKGFGLGLQLCRSYAEQAGGTLKVSSRPGKGTRFELQLVSAD